MARSMVESTPPRALRATFIFRLEQDEWKLVRQHFSVGAPNLEVFGIPLTFSLDQVAEAAESDRPDLAALAATDGTITLVFTDIEGSTSLNALYGDLGWIEVLRAFE
jgi:class 3 adenylate cyclase